MFLPQENSSPWIKLDKSSTDWRPQEKSLWAEEGQSLQLALGSRGTVVLSHISRLGRAGGEATSGFPVHPL